MINNEKRNHIFKPISKFIMKKNLLILVLVLLSPLYAFGQAQITISGTVKDTFKDGIPGVNVYEKGTTNGTITSIDGDFTLTVSGQNATIVVTFVGFKTQEIALNGRTNINIVLEEDVEMLDEVVVTGYSGTQLRSKTTNSISKVKSEALSVGLFSNPAQALSGAVAGLKVIQKSGSPGAAPTIILRGGTNLDGTGSPLIIVDGQLRDGLNDINPEDIESMDIMKDAGATALYGARASNGVVLVTTKTGKKGYREINVKAKMGLNYAYHPHKFLGAEEYIKVMRQNVYDSGHLFVDNDGVTKGYGNLGYLDGAQPFGTGNVYGKSPWSTMYLNDENSYLQGHGWKTMTDPITGKELIFKETDIASYNINQPSMSQDYNINMSGGNDKGTYYAGIGYNHQEGLPVNTFYERYSFVLNASYNVADWLTSTSSLNYNRANWKNMPGSQESEAHYFGRIMSLPPTVRFEDEEGNMLLGNNRQDGNQAYQPDKWQNDNQSDKFTMIQSFQVDFMKGLFLKASANWYYAQEMKEAFTKDFETTPGSFDRTRNTSAEYFRDFRQTYNAVLNFNRTIARDHNVSALLGTEYYDKMYKMFKASGSGAPTDDFGDLGLTSSDAGKRTIDSEHRKMRILSFFGRVNYDYKERYLLSAVFRNDGYSSLLGDNRWGFFPGVSAGWIFGREEFVKESLPFLSFGKFRTSYGVNGNASGIGEYTLQGAYGTHTYNGNVGYLIKELPNPNLRWEKTHTFELGLDLSFFDNKLTTNFTFYNRLTSDKYAQLSLPTSTGVSSITNNNGELRNRGLEIELSGRIIENKDWSWTASGNISYNKNKVISLPYNGMERNRQDAFEVYTGNGNEKMWVGGYQEGQEPGMLYAYKALGIYKSWDEVPANRKVYTMNTTNGQVLYGKDNWKGLEASKQDAKTAFPIQPGDVNWLDVNGDNVIDEFDKVKIGNTIPRWFGGFNSTLRWKGLQLYARFDYALDFWVSENHSQSKTPWYMGCMQGTYNVPELVRDTWSESNPNGKYPRFLWADQLGKGNYSMPSSMFAYRGDYLAIREISLSYSLPEKWISKAKLRKAEVSVTGQNLGYITAAKNVSSPEVSEAGSGYALPRTLLFGLNLTF